MKYKCVNNLDTFVFHDARVEKSAYNPGVLEMEFLGAVAKFNNPCNETMADRYIDNVTFRAKNPTITKFFLEGAKYYNADDVLEREVPDEDVTEDAYTETFRSLKDGYVFVLNEKKAEEEGKICFEAAVDVEDDTYWVEVVCDKVVLEWNNFQNRTGQE